MNDCRVCALYLDDSEALDVLHSRESKGFASLL